MHYSRYVVFLIFKQGWQVLYKTILFFEHSCDFSGVRQLGHDIVLQCVDLCVSVLSSFAVIQWLL